jgi:hypothetical protein
MRENPFHLERGVFIDDETAGGAARDISWGAKSVFHARARVRALVLCEERCEITVRREPAARIFINANRTPARQRSARNLSVSRRYHRISAICVRLRWKFINADKTRACPLR